MNQEPTSRRAATADAREAIPHLRAGEDVNVTDQSARTSAFYDAIDTFQRTHRLPGLQHAQLRGLLAEHLARVFPEPAPASEDGAALRDRIAALFRQPPGVERLGDATPGEIADAVLSVLPTPIDRADVLLEAADAIETEQARKEAEERAQFGSLDHETELQGEAVRASAALLRRMADCPWCESGAEHDFHCPTPLSHNWGCGCPTDRINLHAESGIDTEGCDCGHQGMGLRWHGETCAWVKQLTEDARQLLAAGERDEQQAQQDGAETGTTADRAEALDLTPAEYRAHCHREAGEQIRTAARHLYADAGIRVLAALDGARVCDEENPESGDRCNRHHGHFGFHRHVMATGVYASWVGGVPGVSDIEADPESSCTCASAGDAFVPAGHYADCPSPEARQQHAAAAPAAGQPPADTGEEADRIVAYRLAGSNLHCISCAPSPRGDIWEPVTSDDLPDGGLCAKCGTDVLIPQPKEA